MYGKVRNMLITTNVANENFCLTIQIACQQYSTIDPEDFIYNGERANPDDFPWMVFHLIVRLLEISPTKLMHFYLRLRCGMPTKKPE